MPLTGGGHYIWEARFIANRIKERIGLEGFEPRVMQAHRRVQPFECLGTIAPLRVDRGVVVGSAVALRCLEFCEFSLRIGVPAVCWA